MISVDALYGIIEDGLNSKMGQVAIADKYGVGRYLNSAFSPSSLNPCPLALCARFILSIKLSSCISTYIILFLLYYNFECEFCNPEYKIIPAE
jgi:hypothetical protein